MSDSEVEEFLKWVQDNYKSTPLGYFWHEKKKFTVGFKTGATLLKEFKEEKKLKREEQIKTCQHKRASDSAGWLVCPDCGEMW